MCSQGLKTFNSVGIPKAYFNMGKGAHGLIKEPSVDPQLDIFSGHDSVWRLFNCYVVFFYFQEQRLEILASPQITIWSVCSWLCFNIFVATYPNWSFVNTFFTLSWFLQKKNAHNMITWKILFLADVFVLVICTM